METFSTIQDFRQGNEIYSSLFTVARVANWRQWGSVASGITTVFRLEEEYIAKVIP